MHRLATKRGLCLSVLAALTVPFALTGCYSEGGLGWSEDQAVYVSNEFQPWSISVTDTRTNKEIWAIDVPVGQQLVIHFVEGTGTEDSATPDVMEWALMEKGVEFSSLPNRLAMPASNSRRVNTYLRPVPEYPNAISPAGSKAPITELGATPKEP